MPVGGSRGRWAVARLLRAQHSAEPLGEHGLHQVPPVGEDDAIDVPGALSVELRLEVEELEGGRDVRLGAAVGGTAQGLHGASRETPRRRIRRGGQVYRGELHRGILPHRRLVQHDGLGRDVRGEGERRGVVQQVRAEGLWAGVDELHEQLVVRTAQQPAQPAARRLHHLHRGSPVVELVLLELRDRGELDHDLQHARKAIGREHLGQLEGSDR